MGGALGAVIHCYRVKLIVTFPADKPRRYLPPARFQPLVVGATEEEAVEKAYELARSVYPWPVHVAYRGVVQLHPVAVHGAEWTTKGDDGALTE